MAGTRRLQQRSGLTPTPHPHPQSPPLKTTEAYRDLDNTGTTFLANKLSNHLISEITRKLPEIQSYVDKT